jgi:DNA polymerase-3 subunit delta'
MQFAQLVGQQAAASRLRSMCAKNRLGHALLFLGSEGTGGLPLAVAFAQYLVCEKAAGGGKAGRSAVPPSLFGDEPAPDRTGPKELPADSCGVCPSCVKAAALGHPDIHFAYPVITRKSGDKPVSADYISEWRNFFAANPYGNDYDWLQSLGAENRQGNITAHECADILRKLSLKSFEGGLKILVMWMPEYLGNEGNKLLKLIEEPPADTLFILVAEDESRILPTILSRTQLVRLSPIAPQDMAPVLAQAQGVEESRALAVAHASEGNYREALSMLQHKEEDLHATTREWFNAILRHGPVAQVRWVDAMGKLGRERQKHFLRYVTHLMRQCIRTSALGTPPPAMPDNEVDFILRFDRLTDMSRQEAIVTELEKAAYQIERNANGKILFQALTIKLSHIIRDNSLILIQ